MIIKVCGLRDVSNIREVVDLGVDMIGLNFYKPSPRYVDMESDSIGALAEVKVSKVGVFVNEEADEVLRLVSEYGLNYVQLHGNESQFEVEQLSKYVDVIRVIGVETEQDLQKASENVGEKYVLFDKKSPLYGGTGIKFDWELLNFYLGEVPFLLAGGIGPNEITSLQTIENKLFAGVDLNSKFEIEPANKDIDLLQVFIKQLKLER